MGKGENGSFLSLRKGVEEPEGFPKRNLPTGGRRLRMALPLCMKKSARKGGF